MESICDSDATLEHVWQLLDARFDSSKTPAQQLAYDIMHGGPITTQNSASIITLARGCQTARRIKNQDARALVILDDETAQESIIKRLDGELTRDWIKYKRERAHPLRPTSFSTLSEWIQTQSEIHTDIIKMGQGADQLKSHPVTGARSPQSEEHTSELQSQ